MEQQHREYSNQNIRKTFVKRNSVKSNNEELQKVKCFKSTENKRAAIQQLFTYSEKVAPISSFTFVEKLNLFKLMQN